MARPKKASILTIKDVHIEMSPEVVAWYGAICVQCGRGMERNNPERWEGQPGNQPRAWWNTMDFYCPHCHSFQNVGDDARNCYVKPSGKYLETGRTKVTVVVSPKSMFEQESAPSQPMSD